MTMIPGDLFAAPSKDLKQVTRFNWTFKFSMASPFTGGDGGIFPAITPGFEGAATGLLTMKRWCLANCQFMYVSAKKTL